MQPVYKGPFQASCRGISVDVLKSWMQKAIRRGEVKQALYAGLCLFSFSGDGERWEGYSIYSNLLNRLIVIAGEDIGIGSIKACELIDEHVHYLREAMCKEKLQKCRNYFISLIVFMCLQPKSRLVSWAKTFSWDVDTLSPNLPNLAKWIEKVERFSPPSDVERVKFILSQKEEDELYPFLAVRYAVALHNSKEKVKLEKLCPKSGKKRKAVCLAVYELWNFYLEGERAGEDISLLYKWYCQENENLIYLVLATLLYMGVDYNSECERSEALDFDSLYREAVESDLKPPFWAVDKHTREGRNAGSDREDFVCEGAKICNPWRYAPDKLKLIYDKGEGRDFILKMEEVEEITTQPQGQLLTSRSKRPVYITLEYVYKGSWPNERRYKDKFNKLRERMKLMQELQINFLPYQFGSDEEGNLWLRSKTLFSNGPEGWGVSEVEDKLQGRNIEVVDKQTMGLKELSEFDDDFITDVMFGEQFMFLSYVNCAYLGVGDQNLRNNLVVGDKSYIIDWEDNSGRKSVEKWSDVFSKSSARLERIISEGMTKYDRKEELQQHIASLPDGGGILKPLLKL